MAQRKPLEDQAMRPVSDDLNRIGRAMEAAWKRIKGARSRAWAEWMTIGEGLLEGRRWAMRVSGASQPKGKGYVTAYSEWLSEYHVSDMDESDRAKLLRIMEERPAAEQWRAALTQNERLALNNPTLFWRKWQAKTRVPKAGKIRNNTRVDRAELEQRDERISELEQELETATFDRASPEQITQAFINLMASYPEEDAAVIIEKVVEEIAKRRQELAEQANSDDDTDQAEASPASPQ